MRVRATQAGHYGDYYRDEGSVFDIDDRKFPVLDEHGHAVLEQVLDAKGQPAVDMVDVPVLDDAGKPVLDPAKKPIVNKVAKPKMQVKTWGWFTSVWMEKVPDDTPLTSVVVTRSKHPLEAMKQSPKEARTLGEAQEKLTGGTVI